MEIVYIQCLLMDNDEILHKGKSLGFVDSKKPYSPSEKINIVDIKIKK